MDELNQMQNPNVTPSPMSSKLKNKKTLWIIIAVAVVVAGLAWYFSAMQVDSPQLPVPTPTPEVEAQLDSQLNTEVENIDLGDLDTEFKEIDNDLNSL